MDDTSSAGDEGGGFFGTVNDVLGAVNNFGVSAITLRERYKRAPAPSGAYAVPGAQGSQPGQIAAVNNQDDAPFQITMPMMLIGGAALLLAVVVAFKLRG